MKKLFFPLLAGMIVLACQKEDESQGIEGSWIKTESFTVDDAGNRSHDLLTFAPDCQKDDSYEFTAGQFVLKEGAFICDPSSAANDKYTLYNNLIQFEKLGIWEVISISGSALEVKQYTANGTGFPEIIAVFRRK